MFYIQWDGTHLVCLQKIPAKENNLNPKDWTENNIKVMKSQLKMLGLSLDWDREISTCSPDYYEHQQKLFLDLYDKDWFIEKKAM